MCENLRGPNNTLNFRVNKFQGLWNICNVFYLVPTASTSSKSCRVNGVEEKNILSPKGTTTL